MPPVKSQLFGDTPFALEVLVHCNENCVLSMKMKIFVALTQYIDFTDF